ncbi:hypothetical protein QF205_11025 [Luteimonas composti]|uniref:Uncharacterized protein n=1 Tax=Luteimonas composti TaxID=398257 RepID=A0ABT6MTD1_9GAMM|nr:hypothetical protein [Luteimonas composti]MDH7453595.1 hypothetical protein [Luteimonas composti]
MWTPHLEQFELPDGTWQKVGWVLVDEADRRYEGPEGAVVTGFSRGEMQELADQLNAQQE